MKKYPDIILLNQNRIQQTLPHSLPHLYYIELLHSVHYFFHITVHVVPTTCTSPAHSLCVLMFVCICVCVCVCVEICQGPDPAGHGVWPSEPAGEGLLWPDFPGHGQLQGQRYKHKHSQ